MVRRKSKKRQCQTPAEFAPHEQKYGGCGCSDPTLAQGREGSATTSRGRWSRNYDTFVVFVGFPQLRTLSSWSLASITTNLLVRVAGANRNLAVRNREKQERGLEITNTFDVVVGSKYGGPQRLQKTF